MNKQEFVAEHIARNTAGRRARSPELRAAAAVAAQAQAEAEWDEVNSPSGIVLKYLESKGLKLWISEDGSKRRVYVDVTEANAPFSTSCYFDYLTGTWHEEKGAPLSADAKAAAFKKIEAMKNR